MPYYKAQHEVFIRAIVRHGDQLAAYRQAYPKAKKESAYTAAIRLARQPHIQARVAVAMHRHALQERQRAQEREEHKQRMAEEDTLQKRIWLARVVRGEVEKQRYMQFRGRTILVHETLNPFIILAAIELDTKYEYGTNPKIILDRQFARLYQRATRPIGLALINRTSPSAPLKGGTKAIPPLKGDAPKRQRDVSRKNTQNASKKLTTERSELVSTTKNDLKKRTNSKQNLRPVMYPASNIPAVCNKVKGRVVNTSAAVMHRAETHVVILSEVECNETQRRTTSLRPIKNEMNEVICLISDTAASQEILRDAQNDSLDGKDGLDCATIDTAT